MGGLTDRDSDPAGEHEVIGQGELSEHGGGVEAGAGEFEEIPARGGEVVDEAPRPVRIDPVSPFECAEAHIADVETGRAEAVVLHDS